MSEGWTTEEARRAERWCEANGYRYGTPRCGGRAVHLTPAPGQPDHAMQECQRRRARRRRSST